MGKFFISYRRDDSAAEARLIHDRLCAAFGASRIFLDVDRIDYGDDFVEAIEAAIAESETLLAVIGRNWLAPGADGRARLAQADDAVRLEISTAFAHGLRVLPVLVDGARMPAAAQLPAELQRFARLNAIEITHTRFAYDSEQLVLKLGGTLPAPKPAGEDLLGNLAKGFFAKLGERLASAGERPPPPAWTPPAAPAAPPTYPGVPTPPPAALNLTGTWRTSSGGVQRIWQQGSQLSVEGLNPFGVVVMRGSGSYINGQMHVYYEALYQPGMPPVRGEAVGTASPDGMAIQGNAIDPVTGPIQFLLMRIG